jgi:NAD(P)-dependent dehydrogenase (short-subunit alcohol dehydrogenase family)
MARDDNGPDVLDQGRVAVVTGTAGALGRAIAEGLRAEGHLVVGLDRADHDISAQTLTASYELDICDEQECARAFDDIVRTVGPPTVLVNVAAVIARAGASGATVDSWNQVLGVNLTGTFIVSREFNRVRGDASASIVNISSMRGIHSSPGAIAYSVSKAGLNHLTRLLAREWGPTGCRVNAVAPATVAGDGQAAQVTASPSYVEQKLSAIPLGRLGTADDVVGAVRFLASAESSFVNGAIVPVDGGEYA